MHSRPHSIESSPGGARCRAWRALAALLCLLAVAPLNPAQADSGETLEYEVKAAMIYNFTRFVEWPAESFSDAKAPFVVALIGDDPLGRTVEATLKDKLVAGRPVQFRRIQALTPGEPVQLALILKSEKRRLAEVLRTATRTGLLTVSDIDGFAGAGGAIGIVVEDKKARFDVNLEPAGKAKLTISSKLLRLARSVVERGGGKS